MENSILKNNREERIFASVLSDGKIRVTVPEGTEGAILRTYETSDKKTGSKYELVFTELVGKITKVGFREGTYGTNLEITLTKGSETPVVLSLGTASNYGEDAMKKLLNVDLNRAVKIVPFAFDDEKSGKKRKGVTIWQYNTETNKAERVENYFYDKEGKKNINGYPEPKKKITKSNPEGTLSKDQWKIYFAECREFLMDNVKERFNCEAETVSEDTSLKDFDDMVDEINDSVEVPKNF
jgi:hypothetical protein